MSQQQNVFQSRFGFHPVNYETYLKLKRLKKLYWEAALAFCQWRRWFRKQPQNRFYLEPKKYGVKRKRSNRPIPEPVTCPTWFKENLPKWQYGIGTWLNPVTPLDDRGVLAAFQAARTPLKNSADVTPITLSVKEIDKMLDEAEKWYAEN